MMLLMIKLKCYIARSLQKCYGNEAIKNELIKFGREAMIQNLHNLVYHFLNSNRPANIN